MGIRAKDPFKTKQLQKGLQELGEEGAVQVFRPLVSNDQFLGVVGILQFDVVKYRIEHEYGVKVTFSGLPYSAARWIYSETPGSLQKFVEEQKQHVCLDQHQNHCILMENEWRINFFKERYDDISYSQTSENVQ